MGVGSGVLVFVGVLVRVDVAGIGEGVDVSIAGNGVVVGKTLCPAHAYRTVEKITKTVAMNKLMLFIYSLLGHCPVSICAYFVSRNQEQSKTIPTPMLILFQILSLLPSRKKPGKQKQESR